METSVSLLSAGLASLPLTPAGNDFAKVLIEEASETERVLETEVFDAVEDLTSEALVGEGFATDLFAVTLLTESLVTEFFVVTLATGFLVVEVDLVVLRAELFAVGLALGFGFANTGARLAMDPNS